MLFILRLLRLPPRTTRTNTHFYYTTLFRSGLAPYCEQENLVLTDVRRDGDRCALGDIRVHQYTDLDFERRDVLAAAANHVLDAVCKDVVALRCPNEGVAGMEPTVTPGHCGCFGVVEVRSEEHTSELQSLMR